MTDNLEKFASALCISLAVPAAQYDTYMYNMFNVLRDASLQYNSLVY